MVSRALEYLDKLAKEAGQELSLPLELAAAYDKIGDIQGGFGTSHLGQRQKAGESYRKALAIRELVVKAEPNNTKIQAELAISYDRVAEILTALTKNHSEALFLFRKSQKIGETLLASDPLNTKLRRGQGVGDFNVATVSAKLGDSKTGLDSARKALSIFTEMLAADPQNEEFRQIVAAIQTFVCEMMIKNGDAEEAIKLLSRSLLTLEKSFAVSPTDEIAHFRIANVQAELGKGHAALAAEGRTPTQNRLSHWREARSWLQKSEKIYKTFLDAGKLSGDDAARRDVVIKEIAMCDAAIARLSGNYQ